MKLIKLNYQDAKKLTGELGLCFGEDGKTFYATNEDRTEIWEFESKKKRDRACEE